MPSTPALRLTGRRVLVTGASMGIGESIVRRCAQAGASVALVARSEERLRRLAREVGGRAYPADLSDRAQVRGLIERVECDGPVDVLINNAARAATSSFMALDPDELASVTQLNLVAPMELCRHALPGMLARGIGHIVNISSIAASVPLPGTIVYGATKAGLNHFTAGLRTELKGRPIGLTLVEIGPVRTAMWDHLMTYPASARSVARLRRFGLITELEPDRVAHEIVSAVEHRRRHVRMPRRNLASPLLCEIPRRFTELLLLGVDTR